MPLYSNKLFSQHLVKALNSFLLFRFVRQTAVRQRTETETSQIGICQADLMDGMGWDGMGDPTTPFPCFAWPL